MKNFLGCNSHDFPLPEGMPADVRLARVIEEHRERYFLACPEGIYEAGVTGKIMFGSGGSEDFPAVGDWVAFTPLDDRQGIIHEVLPRKTLLRRRASGRKGGEQMLGANIDIAFIVMAGDEDFSLNRLERYLTIIHEGGIVPVVILNKTDLFTEEELEAFVAGIRHRHPRITLVRTSALTEDGLDFVQGSLLPGKTYCFLGSSGVGKSSLINRLVGGERQRISDLSDATGKGRHTTTYRELIELENGSLLIDTPGMREVGISASDFGLEETFSDIIELAERCRFSDCTHTSEPGCAVIAAAETGGLSPDKLENYLRLKRESDLFRMEDHDRRKKEKNFTKIVREYKRLKPKKS
ncbi:MAG: ribosome small subunit-dependent GTPase A [Candidatus Marinimicrobia bacterium]|nr:ribosome small subunit-dependent GTPase A [Candidatus Neomarinimicrobiota bacterium]